MKAKPKRPAPAELARVLKALPRTADGKVIYPGMKIYRTSVSTRGEILGATSDVVDLVSLHRVFFRDWAAAIDLAQYVGRLFSSRAAALAECRRQNRGAK